MTIFVSMFLSGISIVSLEHIYSEVRVHVDGELLFIPCEIILKGSGLILHSFSVLRKI